MGHIKGLLFDRDGTLIDFHQTWTPAFTEAAAHLARGDADLVSHLLVSAGYDPEAGQSKAGSILAAASDAELAAFWATMLPEESAESILDQISGIFADHLEVGAAPVCDLGLFCQQMLDLGYRLGIATNGSSPSSEVMMRRFGVHHQFAYYAGFDSGHQPKPHPSMALGFCAATGLRPEEIAVIGDSTHDLKLARSVKAGLAIGVLTGTSSEDDLQPFADHVIPNITFLADLLAD